MSPRSVAVVGVEERWIIVLVIGVVIVGGRRC